jgi:site-specific DNA recombinase
VDARSGAWTHEQLLEIVNPSILKKGIAHEPGTGAVMKPQTRDVLLLAIAKARRWVDDLRLGRVASLADIAAREGQGEDNIRFLAPLAFLSPRIIRAIVEGTAPADLRLTRLVKKLSYSWAKQEQSVGIDP